MKINQIVHDHQIRVSSTVGRNWTSSTSFPNLAPTEENLQTVQGDYVKSANFNASHEMIICHKPHQVLQF